jgi:PTS system nitrogen regulatory IIA component
MHIVDFLKPEGIIPHLASATKADVLRELAETLVRGTTGLPLGRVLGVLADREKIGSTGMEKGVAIPHGRLTEISSLMACFGVSKAGVDFDSRDGRPAQFFFALVAPENSAGVHLKALSKISRIFRSDALREAILKSTTAREVYDLIAQEDLRT